MQVWEEGGGGRKEPGVGSQEESGWLDSSWNPAGWILADVAERGGRYLVNKREGRQVGRFLQGFGE